MTHKHDPAECKVRQERRKARFQDWYNAPPEKMREFLGILPWQRSEVIDDFADYLYRLQHTAWLYQCQVDKIRQTTTDPRVHFEASFALAFDSLRDPVENEEELQDTKRRAWAGVMKTIAKKQQREAGNGN